jgi:Secretion system C-terminal sorting domain
MKKIYILSLFLVLSAHFSFAQVITAVQPLLNYSGVDNTTLTAHAEIKNNSTTQTLNVIAENYNPLLTPGHFTYFCWVVCHDTSTYISPDSIVLGPGQTTNLFISYVVPSGIAGYDEITYRYYDMFGMSDTLYLTFTYDFIATGIFEVNTRQNSLFISGPNPASSHTNISYVLSGQKDAKILVTNMLGSTVKEIVVNGNQNTLTVPVKDLNSGVYVYSLVVDGKILSSKKLIVSH